MCKFTQYPRSVGRFPFLPNTRPKLALFIWPLPKRFFDIYKAGKRHQLRGAHRHVKILIFQDTSMATLTQVLLMSNPKGLRAWAMSCQRYNLDQGHIQYDDTIFHTTQYTSTFASVHVQSKKNSTSIQIHKLLVTT